MPKPTDMLGLFSKKPDVIGVSETELKENQHELNNISAYNFLFNNSTTNAEGGSLYIKAEIGFIERPDLKHKSDCVEDIWI